MGSRATRLKIEIEIALADEKCGTFCNWREKKSKQGIELMGKDDGREKKIFIFIKTICKRE